MKRADALRDVRRTEPGTRWRPALALTAVTLVLSAILVLRGLPSLGDVADGLSARRAFALTHPVLASAGFGGFYVAFAALCLPGIWMVSVACGFLFGVWTGAALIGVGYTLGATLAMIASRRLLRAAVSRRFPDFVARANAGVARDGAGWLFAARLTPVIPYFAINLAMGLTDMRVATFAAVTWLGAQPFAFIYAAAGAEMTRLSTPADLWDWRLLGALMAAGAAPLFVGAVWRRWGQRRR